MVGRGGAGELATAVLVHQLKNFFDLQAKKQGGGRAGVKWQKNIGGTQGNIGSIKLAASNAAIAFERR